MQNGSLSKHVFYGYYNKLFDVHLKILIRILRRGEGFLIRRHTRRMRIFIDFSSAVKRFAMLNAELAKRQTVTKTKLIIIINKRHAKSADM